MGIINSILSNYVMIFELLGLLLVLRISAHISPRMKRLTIAVILLLLLETMLFRIEEWLATFETYTIARPMITAVIYTIYPIILLLVMRITSNKAFSKLYIILLLIPEAISVILYFSSQWTNIIFSYGEANNYIKGPLYRCPYAIFGLYIIIFVIHNFIYFKKYSRSNRVVATYIVSGAILGVIVYLAFDFSYEYNALFASALLLYYLCVYIHMARIDPLTSLLNRQSYYQDMKSLGDKISAVVSVDMNDLKRINDTMGHEAGDTALKTVSAVIWENCGKGGTVYRVGGDEFIIFYTNTSENDIKAHIDVMKVRMSKTDYVCAFGYAMKARRNDMDEVIRDADAKMYADKAELKKKALEKAAAGK